MIGQRIEIWKSEEYSYPAAYGFIPLMVSYIHEDQKIRPCMLVVPGGGYRHVSVSEGDIVARRFYSMGYNVFVLAYTINVLDTPAKLQPLHDISRAVRLIRRHAEMCRIDPEKLVVCGFSAGGHLCASLCVHCEDIKDPRPEYDRISNRPDAAILAYPVITSGEYAHRDSFTALFGEEPSEEELEYMSLEKHVAPDTPPCFLWQTASDDTVPVENSYLFAEACRKAQVPFAHHVFTEGVHGMSVADEDWMECRYWEPYTLEQIRLLGNAIKEGRTSYPVDKGEEILRQYGLTEQKPEKWTAEMKKVLRRIFPEVGMWPEMAGRWLERQLDICDIH
ncbi:MAG TPA: alpha/beta hydrolase [Candidatus Mediterraneibacter stercoripullorum]|nr:alpha/beta hydrolase [Candidatus Mediterraneibacter stercoripullorum]